jgi:hypothetical protein
LFGTSCLAAETLEDQTPESQRKGMSIRQV